MALAGRTAIITGAASGIGASIANAFAREGASCFSRTATRGGWPSRSRAWPDWQRCGRKQST